MSATGRQHPRGGVGKAAGSFKTGGTPCSIGAMRAFLAEPTSRERPAWWAAASPADAARPGARPQRQAESASAAAQRPTASLQDAIRPSLRSRDQAPPPRRGLPVLPQRLKGTALSRRLAAPPSLPAQGRPAAFRRALRGRLLAWLLGAAAAAGSLAPAGAQMVPQPIRVPLYWTPIQWGSSPAPSKLGIYVGLAGSSTPQLFEFDTGGSGFYPTYAANAPWWGSNWQATGYTFTQDYDGGNIQYTGAAVTTTLSLFSGPGQGQPLLTASGVVVGQTATINNKPIDPSHTTPPLEQAFWGDFGMAPKQGKAGQDDSHTLPGPAPTLDSLAAQLTYANGVTPGFRVHASSVDPWVQIGLGPQDLTVLSTSFRLHPTGGNSATNVPYFENHVIRGTLAVSDGASGFLDTNTGMILDTGAYATIHNHKHTFPDALISGNSVVNGASVQVSAPSLLPSQLGVPVPFLSFPAGNVVNVDLVSVKDGGEYYLNTGLLPFLNNDVIYVLGAPDGSQGQLTLAPQSVPEPLTASGVAAAAALGGRLRRLRRRIRARDGRH